MKWLVSVRLLRILFALLVIGSTVFFDQICSRPRTTAGCTSATLMLGEDQLKENATVSLDKYELEGRVCTLLKLTTVINDLLRTDPHETAEFVAWNFIVISVDLILILLIHVWFYFRGSEMRCALISAFVLELVAYVGAGSAVAFAAVAPGDKWQLVGEPIDFVPLQYKVITVLFFVSFVVFIVDLYLWAFFDDSLKMKVAVEWKQKLPIDQHDESRLGERRANESPEPQPMIKAFNSDVFENHRGSDC